MHTKKAAIINPGREERYAVQEPLALGLIASYLEKNGIEVKIIDELSGQDVEKELVEFRPDIAGITATTPLAPDAYRIADICKKKGILTVMGGVHATVLPEEALRHVDIVVKGEGEIAMLDIIKDNIASGIISRPYIKNIDELPSPARYLMNMDFYLRTKDRLPQTYLYFVPPDTKTASILTSRGCPHRCIFCHNTWRGIPFRLHSVERIISEIEQLIATYGIRALFFIDDNLFADVPRLRKLCELININRFNIIWGANARVDNIDIETLRIAKQAGCRQVTFGFESGSQRILDILNKGTTVEQNRKAIELCNRAGIIPQGTIMIGNPTETREDIKATHKFIRESNIDSLGICIATPYPGTDLWKWCEENKLIPESVNWSDFTYGKVAIPACNTFSPEEITRLFHETMDIAFHIKFSHFLRGELKHPVRILSKTARGIMHPLKILKLISRLRI